MSTKKYLFIILLVGVCFGQEYSNEISLDEIRKIDEEWQPILSNIKQAQLDLDEADFVESFSAVRQASSDMIEKDVVGDFNSIVIQFKTRLQWFEYNCETFPFLNNEHSKVYMIEKNKYVISLLQIDIGTIINWTPYIKNNQGIYLANKLLDLFKNAKKEAIKLNEVLLDKIDKEAYLSLYKNDSTYQSIHKNSQQYQDTANRSSEIKEKPSEEENIVVYDIPPSPKTAIQPKYPRKALRDELQGVVVIKAFIDRFGYVRETIVSQSIRKDLDKSAIKSLKKSRFNPAKKDGKPVGVWIEIPVNFRLK